MFALQPGAAGAAMSTLAARLDTPRAVIVLSPHWETRVPTVGTATKLDTIHDFGGFDSRLYEIQYPATGCPEAAKLVSAALTAAGLPAETDVERGLDHGAWVPLRQMFPNALCRSRCSTTADPSMLTVWARPWRRLQSKGFSYWRQEISPTTCETFSACECPNRSIRLTMYGSLLTGFIPEWSRTMPIRY
jgi:hypothetical protein